MEFFLHKVKGNEAEGTGEGREVAERSLVLSLLLFWKDTLKSQKENSFTCMKVNTNTGLLYFNTTTTRKTLNFKDTENPQCGV